MEEGTFVGWLKGDGDAVRAGEPLFELEGDKAMQEIESLDGGYLRIAPDGPVAGATVAVGRVIGYLLQRGEALPAQAGRRTEPPAAPNPPRRPRAATPAQAFEAEGAVRITPRARRLARALGIDTSRLRGTGRNGRIRERDIKDVSS